MNHETDEKTKKDNKNETFPFRLFCVFRGSSLQLLPPSPKDFRQKNEGQKNRKEINKPRITRTTRIGEGNYPSCPLSSCLLSVFPSVFPPWPFLLPLLCAFARNPNLLLLIRVIRGQISPSKLRNRKRPANPPVLSFCSPSFRPNFVFPFRVFRLFRGSRPPVLNFQFSILYSQFS